MDEKMQKALANGVKDTVLRPSDYNDGLYDWWILVDYKISRTTK